MNFTDLHYTVVYKIDSETYFKQCLLASGKAIFKE